MCDNSGWNGQRIEMEGTPKSCFEFKGRENHNRRLEKINNKCIAAISLWRKCNLFRKPYMPENFENHDESQDQEENLLQQTEKLKTLQKEHFEEAEREFRAALQEEKESDDVYLSMIFHNMGILISGGKTECVGELLNYVKKQKIDLDKEAINSAKEAAWDLDKSQKAALIFGRRALKESGEQFEYLAKEGEIFPEEIDDMVNKEKELYGGIEYYDVVKTMIALASLQNYLKKETIEEIKKQTPMVIYNPYVLNTVKYFSEYYGVDFEDTLKKISGDLFKIGVDKLPITKK